MVRLQISDLCFVWDNQTLWPNSTMTAGKEEDDESKEQCHLVAGLFSREVVQFIGDPHLYVCSYAVEILYMIVNYLHCSVRLQVTSTNLPGEKVDNNWTGMFGLIQQKIDFFLYPIYFSYEHLELIDTELKLPQKNVLSILSKPKISLHSDNPLKMFDCFTWNIWTLILGSFVLYWVVNIAHCWNCWNNIARRMDNRTNVSDNFFTIFAILIGQGNVPLGTLSFSHYWRPTVFIWMISSLLFRVLYSIDITAVLLSSGPNYIDRFEQLFKMGNDLKILAQSNKISHQIFLQKFPNLSSQLVEIDFSEGTTVNTIQRLVESNSVLIISKERAEDIQRYYFNLELYVSTEGFNHSMRNFPIRRTLNEHCKAKLNRLFKWIHYVDIYRFAVKPITFSNFDLHRKSNPSIGLKELVKESFPTGFPGVQPQRSPGQGPIVMSEIHVGVLINIYLLSIGVTVMCLIAEIVLARRNRPLLTRTITQPHK